MIVPDHDPGRAGVGGLQLGVGLVLRVAAPIVAQRDDLAVRVMRPLSGDRRVHAVGLGAAVLVDVVAQVQHRVDSRQLGDRLVGVEVAVRIERAGGHRQHHVLGRAARQGGGAADGRGDAVGGELEGVGAAGVEARDIDLHRPVAAGPGDAVARLGAAGAAVDGVERPAVGDVAGLGVGRGDASPEDHPVGQRIAGGHAVLEGDRARVPGRRLRRGRAGCAQAKQGQGPTSIDPHTDPPHALQLSLERRGEA